MQAKNRLNRSYVTLQMAVGEPAPCLSIVITDCCQTEQMEIRSLTCTPVKMDFSLFIVLLIKTFLCVIDPVWFVVPSHIELDLCIPC